MELWFCRSLGIGIGMPQFRRTRVQSLIDFIVFGLAVGSFSLGGILSFWMEYGVMGFLISINSNGNDICITQASLNIAHEMNLHSAKADISIIFFVKRHSGQR